MRAKPSRAGSRPAGCREKKNKQAGFLSKELLQKWDFDLRPEVAKDLCQQIYRPGTDLFASSEFHTSKDYISCGPNPQSSRADAFTDTAWPDYSYKFPPVPFISMCLVNIRQSSITVIMVTLVWKAATWWDQVQELAQISIYMGKTHIICKERFNTRLPRLGSLVATVVRCKGHLLSPRQQQDY